MRWSWIWALRLNLRRVKEFFSRGSGIEVKQPRWRWNKFEPVSLRCWRIIFETFAQFDSFIFPFIVLYEGFLNFSIPTRCLWCGLNGHHVAIFGVQYRIFFYSYLVYEATNQIIFHISFSLVYSFHFTILSFFQKFLLL